jgi:hypothetical protein
MKRKGARAFVYGLGPGKSVLDMDSLSLPELVVILHHERDDLPPSPWRWSCSAAIRRALGH